MAAKEGISDAEIRAELGQEVVARGPANWEWVQAMARVLESKIPVLGRVGLSFVRQVDAYLTRQHIQEAVDDIVRPCLLGDPSRPLAWHRRCLPPAAQGRGCGLRPPLCDGRLSARHQHR